MNRTVAFLATLGAALILTGAVGKCSKAAPAPGYEASAEVGAAKRKWKRARKVRRHRITFRAAAHARKDPPAQIDPAGPLGLAMAAIPAAVHEQLPARFLGAELMQPVPAEYIAVAAFMATEPQATPQPLERLTAREPWQHTAGGKVTILLAFFGIVGACGLGRWTVRHG